MSGWKKNWAPAAPTLNAFATRSRRMTGKPLKLKAKDAEDMEVISAVLQDAIAPVSDMIYRPEEKDFVMVVQRFCRESHGEGDGPCFERVRAAVHVRGVTGAQVQNIDQSQVGDMLDLLAVMPEKGALQFVFAGGGKIRLKLGDWALILEDFGEPWPASCEPCHENTNA
jgi:hypothetical protein